MAILNTIIRDPAGRAWEHDDEIAGVLYPREIKKAARKKNLSSEQIMAQLQRFCGKRHRERESEERKREEKHKKETEHNASIEQRSPGEDAAALTHRCRQHGTRRPHCGRRVLRSSTTPPAVIRPRAGSGKPHTKPATTKEFPVGRQCIPRLRHGRPRRRAAAGRHHRAHPPAHSRAPVAHAGLRG
ncbi:hypothetical protein QJS66_08465 [Kocuria rhizophila]|nr:hypothetical protein QJS66_08465 [Kocuria rhizophila]